MYFKSKILDRTFFASSVAPPAMKGIPQKLSELSNSHIYLAQGDNLNPYIKAIQEASDKDINMSRLQLVFFIKELKEIYEHSFVDLAEHAFTASPIQSISKDMYNDALAVAKENIDTVPSRPKETSHLKIAISAINFLYQANYINELLQANGKEAFIDDNEKQSFLKIIKQYEQISNLSINYANIQKSFKSPQSIEENAKKTVDNDLKQNHSIAFKELDKVDMDLGDKHTLWNIVNRFNNPSLDKKESKNFDYPPLNSKEVQRVKDTVCRVMEIDNQKNNGSFISNLAYAANCFELYSYRFSNNSSKNVDSHIKSWITENNKEREKWREASLTQEEIEDKKKILQKVIAGADVDGLITSKASSTIFSTIKILSGERTFDEKPTLVLKGDLNKTIVGTFSNIDKVFVVFKDEEHRHVSENALWGGLVDHQDFKTLNLDKPITQDIKEKLYANPNNKLSNFYSLSTMLSEISSNDIQNTFFKIQFNVDNQLELTKTKKSRNSI